MSELRTQRGVAQGIFPDGSGWLRTGQGPPLVMSLGFTPRHGPLRGIWRQLTLRSMRAFASDLTVWAITRPPGIPPDADISWLAQSLMRNIHAALAEPVTMLGSSTGAAVALQAAIEHPEQVEQLVVADGAGRLTDWGRAMQSRLADDLERGRQRRGWLRFLTATDGWGRGALTATVGSLLPNGLLSSDVRDAVSTLRAENAFDAGARLVGVRARTLVIGGSRDRLYGPEPMRDTAAGIPTCQQEIVGGAGHGVALTPGGHRLILDFIRQGRPDLT